MKLRNSNIKISRYNKGAHFLYSFSFSQSIPIFLLFPSHLSLLFERVFIFFIFPFFLVFQFRFFSSSSSLFPWFFFKKNKKNSSSSSCVPETLTLKFHSWLYKISDSPVSLCVVWRRGCNSRGSNNSKPWCSSRCTNTLPS